MPLCVVVALVLVGAPADPVKDWQTRYEAIVTAMKKRDSKPFLKVLHKDYTELADGLVVGVAEVKKQLPARMDTLAQYGSKPKVISVKLVGNTTQVTFTMSYKATKVESKKKAVYESTSKLMDTWLKVGSGWQLYRSAVLESKTTRNGKIVKRPGG